MSPRGGGFLHAARQILEEAGEPLHGLEIVRRGRDPKHVHQSCQR